MIIANNNTFISPVFKSKNKEIRVADDIMRKVTNEYPSLSTTRIRNYNIFKKNENLIDKLFYQRSKIFSLRSKTSRLEGFDLLNMTMKEVKDKKVANCAELSRMAQTAFIANGFKDTRVVTLNLVSKINSSMYSRPLDVYHNVEHSVLLVNAGKNAKLDNLLSFDKHAFIVDPWLGIVDYVPPALNKYKSYFSTDDKIKISDDEVLKQYFIFQSWEDKPNISQKDCDEFASRYPELVV